MRHVALQQLSTVLLLSLSLTSAAIQLPEFRPFTTAFVPSFDPTLAAENNETAHQDLKRQNSNACPNNYDSCANLGAPSVCCDSDAVCSADFAGHVACCPKGAACSGVVSGVITAGTLSDGSLVGGGAAAATETGTSETTTAFVPATTTSNGLVQASTVPTGYNTDSSGQTTGFIFDGQSNVATPGAAARGPEMPLLAVAIIRLLQYLPI
ncbi:hypothetical protein K431DRAFT_244537 [Polychaeton citri CBS 116435]|uniref:Granulins domain-containing protein n=1 Tax=Polychaeton citri CBS 116435 TaxID=1314669 RepID=A0A9P4URG2_9PEZI|nr:hypothetical protein K431DRAFT_244537 [Polychaeton citri CBS 116435]